MQSYCSCVHLVWHSAISEGFISSAAPLRFGFDLVMKLICRSTTKLHFCALTVGASGRPCGAGICTDGGRLMMTEPIWYWLDAGCSFFFSQATPTTVITSAAP